MMDRLIRFAVSHRLLVLLLVAMVAGAGVYSFQQLPIDAVPDVTNVQVQVLTIAPALAPLEVERQITFPVEVAMSGLPDLAEIRSVSKFGLSAVTVVFKDSVDIYFARQLMLERLSQARENIPANIGAPEMGPISTGLGEIYQYELAAEPGSGYDAMKLHTIHEWNVRRQLMGVPGVTEVNSFGGLEKQYQVRLDPARLQAYGLSLRDVLEAVTRNNANVGGAFIEHGAEQYLLRGIGLVQSVEDIAGIVVKTGREGVPVFVRDLGEVVTGAAVRQGAVTADGEGEIVAGIALMLKGENSRTVVERVKSRVEEVKKTLPKGVKLIPFYDRSELVNRTMWTVAKNLIEGALIVIFVLILLLGNWRGALLVATMIPLSMLIAAILMRLFNVSGNLMSLGAIDFGLIVDGGVIMTENAVRRVAERQREMGRVLKPEELRNRVADAALEVRRATMFGELIIMVVYLPLLSLIGVEGKMFKPMALTVIFALAGAFVLSLTYVPAALTFVLRGRVSENESSLIHLARRWYRPALGFVMRRRRRALAAALAIVVVSGAIFPLLGAEFMPRLDEGALAIEARLPPSVSLSHSIEIYSEAERALRRFPEVTKVVTKIGRAEVATDPMGAESGDIYIELKPPAEWKTARSKEKLVEKMSAALEQSVPEGVFSFSQPIELRVAELISGVRSDVAIKIFGDDLETLKQQAEKVSRVVSKVRGAEDVKVEQVAGLPQLQVKPDRAAIARYGINVEDVNNLVESIVAGKDAGQVYEGEQRFGLVVRLKEGAGRDVEAIKNLLVTAPNGARAPLQELADIAVVEGPAQVSREDTRRRISVELNVRGRDIGSFVNETKAALEREVKLPAGYYFTWGGQFENLERASRRLLIVVPLALLFIFILLHTTFHSARQALLIFTGIPFAVVGGVLALALRGMPFSISAGVGFIALFGVAVLNGVVMISAVNRLREDGYTVEDAVREGADMRLRPVLMTALVASLGFIPMAIATSAGAEVQRPLATVVIGGLVTSTLLTLLILPMLYRWFESEYNNSPPCNQNHRQRQAMIKDWVNPFVSFRARILIFVTIIVLTTIAAIYYINRHLEERIAGLVAEHIKAISVSVDLAQSSFPKGEYIHDLYREDGRITVGMEETNIIHKIIVVDANNRVIDSAEAGDKGKTQEEALGGLVLLNPANPRPGANVDGRDPELALTYPVETDIGKRKVVIIVSPHLLGEVVREESQERLIAIVGLSLLLILIIALVSWRFTRPIQELSYAALRVSSGDFDFSVPATQRDEMGALARAFNEMLAGLRVKRGLEERLQRAERSALTGRIAAGIAHEIRNPLSFINLTMDFMRDKFAPAAETARDDYTKLCDSVKEEIARLNRMVSDFLSYGRPARLKLREINARGLIEEVMDLVRAQADQQGVSLSVEEKASDNGATYDAHFRGDAEQLKTCFSNLAINAVQAMAAGGALRIALRPQKNNLRFEVADTGPGIASEALEQIFEPYFSTKETGIGLGLALTRKLIEDHGGQITVSSEAGAGAIFTVILPREPAPEQQAVFSPQPALNTT